MYVPGKTQALRERRESFSVANKGRIWYYRRIGLTKLPEGPESAGKGAFA